MGRWIIPTEVYSRIVGYMRPLKNWNIGKQQEFKDRNSFSLGKIEENLKRLNDERDLQGSSKEN